MWTQIVGKTRLALSPLQAHWWNVPLYVSARGLNTSAMPYGSEFLEITFDFVSHELQFRMSTGATMANSTKLWPDAARIQLRSLNCSRCFLIQLFSERDGL